MLGKKTVLLKFTGSIFLGKDGQPNSELIKSITRQIKLLKQSYSFGIVIGGGNFFRGSQHGVQLGLTPSIGHHVGMLATIMNGLMLQDLFAQQGLSSMVLSAVHCPGIASDTCPQKIRRGQKEEKILIFAGGTGSPFFTTDTNAVVRALQIGADQVWKATGVNGVYNKNPQTNPEADYIKKMSYQEAVEQEIKVMDATAFTLARQHNLVIRLFSIFEKDSLLVAAQQPDFGSIIS